MPFAWSCNHPITIGVRDEKNIYEIHSCLVWCCIINDCAKHARRTQKNSGSKLPSLNLLVTGSTRATASDIAPTNELLRGQIIGRLFGPNTTNTSEKTSSYFEQRFVPMFIYTPSILDGVCNV